MRPPRGELGAAQLRILLALVRVHARDGRATVRSVAAEAGLSSTNTAWNHLRTLRAAGFAEWDDGKVARCARPSGPSTSASAL